MTQRKLSLLRNADDPEQSCRFIDMARELKAEEPASDSDQILRRVASADKVTAASPRKKSTEPRER